MEAARTTRWRPGTTARSPRPMYRSYYLRAFDPSSAYVSIHNGGAGLVDYRPHVQPEVRSDQAAGSSMRFRRWRLSFRTSRSRERLWRFIRDNRYFFDPLTGARWYHSPAIFFNSAGFGYCDDAHRRSTELLITAMGYSARVWGLNGHVVAEVLVNNRWEMWDPDLEVYYRNRTGSSPASRSSPPTPISSRHPSRPASEYLRRVRSVGGRCLCLSRPTMSFLAGMPIPLPSSIHR